MFISQIIFLFLVLATCLLFHFVSFIWICLCVACMPDWASHTNQAQNNFRNRKKTVFSPNVNHSRFHLRYGMVRQCIALSCTLEHTHSLTHSQAQVRRIWELAFDLYGTGLVEIVQMGRFNSPLCTNVICIYRSESDGFLCLPPPPLLPLHLKLFQRTLWMEISRYSTPERRAKKKKRNDILIEMI